MKKELAIITAYIQYHNLLDGTFFNTIDTAYKLAKKFVKIYPPSYVWGIDKEYDETIEKFVEQNKIKL